MIQVGNRASRPALTAAIASVLAPVAIVPHVFEDLTEGTFATFGLDPLAAGLLVGGTLTLQLLGALAAAKERRSGYLVVLLVAAVWIVLAVVDHPAAFVPGEFRQGALSRLAIWGLVGIQAVAALAALTALRSSRRGSFSGTGTITGNLP